jgi:hypothetical protein
MVAGYSAPGLVKQAVYREIWEASHEKWEIEIGHARIRKKRYVMGSFL